MVKVSLNKRDLVPGKAFPPHIFREIGLDLGDTFENNYGQKLFVQQASSSDDWYLVPLNDTELEKQTKGLLENKCGFEEDRHFVSQFSPSGSNRRIDFAFPLIRLAIEPHASYLWEVNDGKVEQDKERELNDLGWDILWLDEDILSDENTAVNQIKTEVRKIMDAMEVRIQDEKVTFQKVVNNEIIQYDEQTVNNAIPKTVDWNVTVVFQGEIVPDPWATLHPATKS